MLRVEIRAGKCVGMADVTSLSCVVLWYMNLLPSSLVHICFSRYFSRLNYCVLPLRDATRCSHDIPECVDVAGYVLSRLDTYVHLRFFNPYVL